MRLTISALRFDLVDFQTLRFRQVCEISVTRLMRHDYLMKPILLVGNRVCFITLFHFDLHYASCGTAAVSILRSLLKRSIVYFMGEEKK